VILLFKEISIIYYQSFSNNLILQPSVIASLVYFVPLSLHPNWKVKSINLNEKKKINNLYLSFVIIKFKFKFSPKTPSLSRVFRNVKFTKIYGRVQWDISEIHKWSLYLPRRGIRSSDTEQTFFFLFNWLRKHNRKEKRVATLCKLPNQWDNHIHQDLQSFSHKSFYLYPVINSPESG